MKETILRKLLIQNREQMEKKRALLKLIPLWTEN